MLWKIFLTLVATLICLSFVNEIWKNDIDVSRTIKRFINSKLHLAKKFEEPKLKYGFDLYIHELERLGARRRGIT